jgi:hypothetical protein
MEKPSKAESIRQYQRRYYLQKIKNKPKVEREIEFKLERFINNEWKVMCVVYK